ncbi:MAG TPA: hypothetical protein VII01_13955 [Solirubrobacteraceae bacterium]
MYHVEIRQFPHNAWRFNLSDGDLVTVVEPWVREVAVDFGERRWSPHTARLTILQGEPMKPEQLTMGRGWRAAERQSEDVTEKLLASAREFYRGSSSERAPSASPQATDASSPVTGLTSETVGDPLGVGVQIAALLGPDAARLLDAWRAAAAAPSDLKPSQSLAVAEQALAATD